MSISRDKLEKPQKPNNVKTCCIGCLAIFVLCAAIIGISTKIGGKIEKYEEPKVTVKAVQQPGGGDSKYDVDISGQDLRHAIYKSELEAYDKVEGLLKLKIVYEGSDIYFILVTENVTPEEMKYIIWEAISTYTYNLCSVCPAVDKPNRNYYSHYYINYTVHVICMHPGEDKPYWQFVKPFGKSFPYSSIDDKITNLK